MPDENSTATVTVPTSAGSADSAGGARPSGTFRVVPRYALIAVLFFAMCLSPIAFLGGPWFLLFLIPLAMAWWVLRTRSVIDPDQLRVLLAWGSRRVPWSDVATLRVSAQGWVHAVRSDESEVALVGVRARDLGRVAQASDGRVSMPSPDQVAADRERARELEATRMRLSRLRSDDQPTAGDQRAPDDQPTRDDQPQHDGRAAADADSGTTADTSDR